MATTTVALEITEESVRAVEMTAGRAPQVVAAAEVPLPPEAAKDSEVLDKDAVAVALRQLWAAGSISQRRVVLAVGSRRILVREYTTQAMRPDLLRQALPFQVQDLLPVPASQAVLDFYPTSQEGDQITGLLVAAVSETIEDLIETVAKAKLHVDRVDLVPFGLARVAARVAPPGHAAAMIHLGDHTSHIVIAVDGVPRFVRIIPIDIAQRTDVPTTTAPVATTRAALRAGITLAEPVINDLTGTLKTTLSFAASRPGGNAVRSAWVSGSGWTVPGVADAVTAALALPVEPVTIDRVAALRADIDPDLALDAVATAGVLLGEVRR